MKRRESESENEEESGSRGATDRKRKTSGSNARSDRVATLHRAVGNQAVQRLSRNGQFGPGPSVGRSVTGGGKPPSAGSIFRLPRPHAVQRSAAGGREDGPAGEVGAPDAVRDVVSSPGTSMDDTVQREMESKMGGDFGDVRIHTGSRAAAAAESIDARAFTVGNHVAFNSGEYRPGTDEGKKVMAHELTHVRQQTEGAVSMLPKAEGEHPGTGSPVSTEGGAVRHRGTEMHVQPKLEVSSPDSPAEREAERVAEQVMRMDDAGTTADGGGDRVSVRQSTVGRKIQRAPAGGSGKKKDPGSLGPTEKLKNFILDHEGFPTAPLSSGYTSVMVQQGRIVTEYPPECNWGQGKIDYEGAVPYDDSKGYATIGIGKKIANQPPEALLKQNDSGYKPYHDGIPKREARDMFKRDIEGKYSDPISGMVERPLYEHQFDALVDLAYGCWHDNVRPVAEVINSGGSAHQVAQKILEQPKNDTEGDDKGKHRHSEAVMYVEGRYDLKARYSGPSGGGSQNQEGGERDDGAGGGGAGGGSGGVIELEETVIKGEVPDGAGAAGGSATAAGGGGSGTYTVRADDSLWAIAKKKGIGDSPATGWKILARENGIDPEAYKNGEVTIHEGQKLQLPGGGSGSDWWIDLPDGWIDLPLEEVREAFREAGKDVTEVSDWIAENLDEIRKAWIEVGKDVEGFVVWIRNQIAVSEGAEDGGGGAGKEMPEATFKSLSATETGKRKKAAGTGGWQAHKTGYERYVEQNGVPYEGMARTWDGFLNQIHSMNWMGHTVYGHEVFLDRLTKAWEYLATEHPDILESGDVFGNVSDSWRSSHRDTSYHVFGMGIDIDAGKNPWLANEPDQRDHDLWTIWRSVWLAGGPDAEPFTPPSAWASRNQPTEEIWSRFNASSRAVERYFELLDNPDELKARVNDLGEPPERIGYQYNGKTSISNLEDADVNTWQEAIKYDKEGLSDDDLSATHGFMNLRLELVKALRDEAGFTWGGCGFGASQSGDFMHFDLRNYAFNNLRDEIEKELEK